MQGALLKGCSKLPSACPTDWFHPRLGHSARSPSFVVSCASLLTSFRAEDCCSPPPGPRVMPPGVGDRASWTHPSPALLLPSLFHPALPTHQPALVRGFLQTCPAPESLWSFPCLFSPPSSLSPSFAAVERLRPGVLHCPHAQLPLPPSFQTTVVQLSLTPSGSSPPLSSSPAPAPWPPSVPCPSLSHQVLKDHFLAG